MNVSYMLVYRYMLMVFEYMTFVLQYEINYVILYYLYNLPTLSFSLADNAFDLFDQFVFNIWLKQSRGIRDT